jgi:hypothetical protein
MKNIFYFLFYWVEPGSMHVELWTKNIFYCTVQEFDNWKKLHLLWEQWTKKQIKTKYYEPSISYLLPRNLFNLIIK